MAAWDYDPDVDAAVIHIIPRDEIPPEPPVTIDLEGIHVLIDVDSRGNILTIELLGDSRKTVLRDLGRFLKQEANEDDGTDDDHG